MQLDKATADAAEYKAGFDKAVYDNFEQKAQVGAAFLTRPAQRASPAVCACLAPP
jgi:hypothetical protein